MSQKRHYGSINAPAQVGELNGEVYGLFYRGGVRHIAPYVPYQRPPGLTLCRQAAGSGTREIENLCPQCAERAKALLGDLVFS